MALVALSTVLSLCIHWLSLYICGFSLYLYYSNLKPLTSRLLSCKSLSRSDCDGCDHSVKQTWVLENVFLLDLFELIWAKLETCEPSKYVVLVFPLYQSINYLQKLLWWCWHVWWAEQKETIWSLTFTKTSNFAICDKWETGLFPSLPPQNSFKLRFVLKAWA